MTPPATGDRPPLTVLIIDESPVLPRVLATALTHRHGLHAVTCSGSLEDVRDHLMRYHPAVLVLDVDLRTAKALPLLAQLRTHYPVPIIVTIASADDHAPRALQALRAGALEIVQKPVDRHPATLQAYARDLAEKIRVAATQARPVRQVPPGRPNVGLGIEPAVDPARWLVAIGASTGGTRALETVLTRVPSDFPPTVIVQHMPAGFTRSFAARLDSLSALSVAEAVDLEPLRPGRALIARGDTQLVVESRAAGWRVRYTDQQLVNRHCPSVDVLFDSVAAAAGPAAIGILMTGMGDDGARGLLRIRQAGGTTITQERRSCVVYGMPKVAVELGAAMFQATPEELPARVLRVLRERGSAAEGCPATAAT